MRPLTTLCVIATFAIASVTWSAATVTNVRGSQRTDGTGTVDIFYDLSGAAGSVMVSLVISNDNGVNYTIFPSPSRVSGDIGSGITNGANRHIIWDAASDRPEIYWPNCKARVQVGDIGQGITFTLPGGVPLELVKIPAGSFQMGSSDFGWSSLDETPVHAVTFASDFYMGKFEFTQAQWFAVMANNVSNCSYGCGPDYPVHDVSWNAIQPTISGLNALGLGGTFRLPSEAEWEYAARAGTTTRFFFGESNCVSGDCVNTCELDQYAWYCANTIAMSHPVGQKSPNPFGLFDILGNVKEWVQDTYHSSYLGAPSDGTAWVDGASSQRGLRGGSLVYQMSPGNYRSSRRDFQNEATSVINYGDLYGFRVVWTP